MIIDAATPLLLEHGQAVTTRQIAECAGIAEGTVFRAFGSKEELIRAAVAKQLDPEPFRRRLSAIDPALPLEERVHALVVLMRDRFTKVFTLMTALGTLGKPPGHDARREFAEIMGDVLGADADRLNVPAERAAQIIRMVTLAASVPQMRVGSEFTDEEITATILYGIVGAPAPAPNPAT